MLENTSSNFTLIYICLHDNHIKTAMTIAKFEQTGYKNPEIISKSLESKGMAPTI